MVDVITALTRKREALQRQKREIENDYMMRKAEIEGELRRVNQAIDTINKAMEDILCPTCHGSGELKRCDAAGQSEGYQCPDCDGTGIKAV